MSTSLSKYVMPRFATIPFPLADVAVTASVNSNVSPASSCDSVSTPPSSTTGPFHKTLVFPLGTLSDITVESAVTFIVQGHPFNPLIEYDAYVPPASSRTLSADPAVNACCCTCILPALRTILPCPPSPSATRLPIELYASQFPAPIFVSV